MRVAPLLVASMLTSCSYLVVTPAGDVEPCTEGNLAPIFDVSLSAINALALVVGASRCYQKSDGGIEQNGSPSVPCTTGAYVGLSSTAVLGVATALSSIHGFRATRECRAQHDATNAARSAHRSPRP